MKHNGLGASTTRVMIIDRDSKFRELLKDNLNAASGSYEICFADKMVHAVQAAHEDKHDVYVVDFDLDASQSSSELIKKASGGLRPVILIAEQEDSDLGDKAIDLGASDFLTKRQITGELLDRIIRNALRRRRRLLKFDQIQKEPSEQPGRDALTGLLNLAQMEKEIEQQLVRKPRCGALLCINLDDFNMVNDYYGHAAGDQLLRSVATRLNDAVHPADIVGRLGGDEFVVYLNLDPNSSRTASNAESVATKLVHAITQLYYINLQDTYTNEVVSVNASIGIALFPDDGDTYGELLYLAEQAMNKAKVAGQNSCIVIDNKNRNQFASN